MEATRESMTKITKKGGRGRMDGGNADCGRIQHDCGTTLWMLGVLLQRYGGKRRANMRKKVQILPGELTI